MDQQYNFYIVTEQPQLIIQKCRKHAQGTLRSFLFGFCILYIFINWIPQFLGLVFPVSYADLISGLTRIDQQLLNSIPDTPLAAYLYSILFSGVFQLGKALYTMTYIRNRKVEYRAMWEGLQLWSKALGMFILKTIVIGIGLMLFIIPGIMYALNFSQSYFILADNPDKRVMEILLESKQMMLGNRMNYFMLILNYFPYLFLGYLPSFAVENFTSLDTGSGTGFIIFLIAEIPFFLACGWLSIGQGAYYELLRSYGFSNFRYAGESAFRENEPVRISR